MQLRGIRGAISVKNDLSEEICEATEKLLNEILINNNLQIEDIASVFFTVTPDLKSCFPANAARNLGWDLVPLLCSTEIPVAGSAEKTIRVLVHVNTLKTQREIKHIYLNDAKKLRPDL